MKQTAENRRPSKMGDVATLLFGHFNFIIVSEHVFIPEIWCVLFYRRHHTFDVKTCFQQIRYVFDVIVTSWALFVFCISWNFARDIWTVFEEIKHLRSREPDNIYKIIKINKTQLLLKYFWCTRCYISWKATGKCSNITSA